MTKRTCEAFNCWASATISPEKRCNVPSALANSE